MSTPAFDQRLRILQSVQIILIIVPMTSNKYTKSWQIMYLCKSYQVPYLKNSNSCVGYDFFKLPSYMCDYVWCHALYVHKNVFKRYRSRVIIVCALYVCRKASGTRTVTVTSVTAVWSARGVPGGSEGAGNARMVLTVTRRPTTAVRSVFVWTNNKNAMPRMFPFAWNRKLEP